MPTFKVTDPQSGQTVRLTGDSPPTEQELEQIFSTIGGQQQAMQPAQQPAGGILGDIKEFVTGKGRETEATKTLPEIGGISTGEVGKDIRIAAGLLASTDPNTQVDIIKSVVPEATFKQDEKGNTIVDLGNGKRAILNKPGASFQDLTQGIAQFLAFLPSARIAGLGTTLVKKLGLGAIAAGATETGLQAAEQASGGKQGFKPKQIATTAALGGATELVAPIVGAARQAVKPIAKVVGEGLTQALQKGTVLTSDVFPPTTFAGKAAQKLSERIPFAGTGKVRVAQQVTRQEAVEDLAREFDIDPNSDFSKSIIKSLDKVFKGSQKRAGQLRTEAVKELDKFGDIPTAKTASVIDDEIVKIQALGVRGDNELIKTLTEIKGELSGDFSRIKDIRSTIFQEITDVGNFKSPVKSGGDAVLSKVAGALSGDLDNFAKEIGKTGVTREARKAASKWAASNRIFKDNFAKIRETELKRALSKGKLTPEIIQSTIKGGKLSELKRLRGNIDLKGRISVQQSILKNALDKSGFPDNINPTIFLNELNRGNTKKAVEIFFKGKEKVQLEGLKKFLNLTRRSQEQAASLASQQEVAILGFASGIATAPAETILAATVTGLISRGFESKPVRDLLIKLAKTKSPKAIENIMRQIKPLILAGSRNNE